VDAKRVRIRDRVSIGHEVVQVGDCLAGRHHPVASGHATPVQDFERIDSAAGFRQVIVQAFEPLHVFGDDGVDPVMRTAERLAMGWQYEDVFGNFPTQQSE
jgi:hypothetical protein